MGRTLTSAGPPARTEETTVQVVIATDEDAVTYLVAVHRPERPEDWTVELHAGDGTVEPMTGRPYGMFPSLWHRHRDLYAWCMPSAAGTVVIEAPGGWRVEKHWDGDI